jgi:hypothetical protein
VAPLPCQVTAFVLTVTVMKMYSDTVMDWRGKARIRLDEGATQMISKLARIVRRSDVELALVMGGFCLAGAIGCWTEDRESGFIDAIVIGFWWWVGIVAVGIALAWLDRKVFYRPKV